MRITIVIPRNIINPITIYATIGLVLISTSSQTVINLFEDPPYINANTQISLITECKNSEYSEHGSVTVESDGSVNLSLTIFRGTSECGDLVITSSGILRSVRVESMSSLGKAQITFEEKPMEITGTRIKLKKEDLSNITGIIKIQAVLDSALARKTFTQYSMGFELATSNFSSERSSGKWRRAGYMVSVKAPFQIDSVRGDGSVSNYDDENLSVSETDNHSAVAWIALTNREKFSEKEFDILFYGGLLLLGITFLCEMLVKISELYTERSSENPEQVELSRRRRNRRRYRH